MIGLLAGEIVDEAPDGTLIIDVAGVGWEVATPAGTRGRAGANGGGRAVLHVHTHVRDDAIDLYGFATRAERDAFRLLIGLPSVGPKTALGVLSALPLPELARAIERKDLGRLTAVSGVGKKTAERLILELGGKLPAAWSAGGAPAPARPDDAGRLVGALTNMGYRPSEAERAVRALGDRVGREPLSDLLRAALAQLAT
jgi:Holliday junction DNA helicase RuvA